MIIDNVLENSRHLSQFERLARFPDKVKQKSDLIRIRDNFILGITRLGIAYFTEVLTVFTSFLYFYSDYCPIKTAHYAKLILLSESVALVFLCTPNRTRRHSALGYTAPSTLIA